MPPRLVVEDLEKHFPKNDDLISQLLFREQTKYVNAVDGVSLEIERGETLGIAGESGCGKSTLGRTVLRLHEPDAGRILFEGEDVCAYDKKELQEFRRNAQLIHQDPYQAINPRWKVHKWIREPLRLHGIGTREEREEMVAKTLETVGLTPVENFWDVYGPNLSGGQRQRVNIARSIILEPAFFVADEPVSMLDVSIRAEILDLIESLQEQLDLSIMYISHDLSMLRYVSDRIAIMYLGKIVEQGPADEVIRDPQHPYTKALVSSMPSIYPDRQRERYAISGNVPDPVDVPDKCRFIDRCPEAMEVCGKQEPRMYDITDNHVSRCYLHDEDVDRKKLDPAEASLD